MCRDPVGAVAAVGIGQHITGALRARANIENAACVTLLVLFSMTRGGGGSGQLRPAIAAIKDGSSTPQARWCRSQVQVHAPVFSQRRFMRQPPSCLIPGVW